MDADVVGVGTIHGSMQKNPYTLQGKISSRSILKGVVSKPTYIGQEYYEGEYSVTPLVTAQTLATQDKTMMENLVIEKIPYSEVSNPRGGTTIIIGG